MFLLPYAKSETYIFLFESLKKDFQKIIAMNQFTSTYFKSREQIFYFLSKIVSSIMQKFLRVSL